MRRRRRRVCHPAAQNEQWCAAAKSVSACGCGGTSDITCAPSLNDGQGSARDDGLPVAAKFAQAARMLAASVCWAAVRVAGYGAFGWSNRYGSSVPCVAMGGSTPGGATFTGAWSSLNW